MNDNKYKYLFTCALASCCVAYASQPKPNILVFVADDAGMDFGCYGNRNIKTPNIDRLAAEGLRFEKAFLTSSQSSPSRTSMMTGKFAHNLGTEDLYTPIDERTLMLPRFLKQADYDQQNVTEESYRNYGQFINDSDSNPFFLWVGFSDPHRDYNRNTCPQVNWPETTM